MVKLKRLRCSIPRSWHQAVRGSLPDVVSFRREAARFEKVPLADPRRLAGFAAFAPHLLAEQDGRREFPAVWRRWQAGEVKVLLKAVTAGHCAYCQSHAAADQHGDVEHYQPKSLFPRLVYRWDNYFFSCTLCNGAKGNKWPDRGGYVRPDRGQPERNFVFHEDGRIEAAPGRTAAAQMISDFALDREDLQRARQLQMGPLLGGVRDILRMVGDKRMPVAVGRELVHGMLRRVRCLSPYSVAVKQNLRRAWNEAFLGQPGLQV